ncbi:MAG TPA: TetR/AcrR family transcriptional regulator [Puia sp.]|nr:TetR/AcrR family transcriptional regulator [Puia sp.]
MPATPDHRPLKDDRRTLRTKRSLAEALKQLILEKGYEDVTVQDIIDKADVGRSTFYAHYESKDQLLVGNINFQQAFIDPPSGNEVYPMGINLTYLFDHTKEHLSLVRRLSGTRGMVALTDFFTELCAARIMEHHKVGRPRSKTARSLFRYKAEAAAGGIVRMLSKWLEDGAVIPVEEMVTCATRILTIVNYPG